MSNVNHANDRKAALIGQLMTLLMIFCSSKVFSKVVFNQLSPSGTRVSLISVGSNLAGLLKNRSEMAKRNQIGVCVSKYLNKLSKNYPHMLVCPPAHLVIISNYLICRSVRTSLKLRFRPRPRVILTKAIIPLSMPVKL